MMRSSDLPKAEALLKNAIDTIEAIRTLDNKSPRFLLSNQYAAILELTQSILAASGISIRGQDHHKESIEELRRMGLINQRETAILDNLRKVRNDIQYYGTKSTQEIDEFYTTNRAEISGTTEKLKDKAKAMIDAARKSQCYQ